VTTQAISLDAPLDALVEAEGASGDSPAWRSEALAYDFAVETPAHQLQASEYFGKGLDWFHFDIVGVRVPFAPPTTTERVVVPAALQFRGMPHPKWWRFASAVGCSCRTRALSGRASAGDQSYCSS